MPSVVPQLLMLKAEFMDNETNIQTDKVFVSYCKVPLRFPVETKTIKQKQILHVCITFIMSVFEQLKKNLACDWGVVFLMCSLS